MIVEQVNLYYLLPESTPTNTWMRSNNDLQDEVNIVHFMNELDEIQYSIRLENYTGYFDSENVKNFLEDFETAQDYYPNPVFTLMRKKMLMWYDWRKQPHQRSENDYELHGQNISNHTFSEITEHKNQNSYDNFVLVNHQACNCPSPIEVLINKTETVEIDSVSNSKELFEWFAENRLPIRDFHTIEKHGENRTKKRKWNGKWASPLRCSEDRAFEILQRAVGVNKKELFNRDDDNADYYIVFKHEGNNPQNMYHGYHVPKESDEIPKQVKERLQD